MPKLSLEVPRFLRLSDHGSRIDHGRDDGETSSNDGYVFANKKQKVDEEEESYSHVTKLKPEPEWDVDSYDDREYESDPEDSKFFSDEEDYQEYRIRKREAFDSKGFVYEPLSGDYPIRDLEEFVYSKNRTARELMTDLANVCVKKYNEEKGKKVELVDIVRVIIKGGATLKSYITFMARETHPNGPLVEYQAKALTHIGDKEPPFPILCRPSCRSSI